MLRFGPRASGNIPYRECEPFVTSPGPATILLRAARPRHFNSDVVFDFGKLSNGRTECTF
jgi:hypothetical protein